MKKKKILFMVQVPPPVHGAALRNLSLYESKLLNENFNIKLARLSFADSILTIGKPSLKKLIKTFTYAFRLIYTIISFRPRIAYFTLTPAGGAFYRDCLFVLILKIFNIRILYHLRGLGIRKARNKNGLNRVLYNFAFKNTYVVCLSKTQLKDIEGLKYRKHFVVPNGIKTEYDPSWKKTSHPGKKNLLFLSNFVESKGIFEFLDAVKSLKDAHVNFEARVVGADYDITRADVQQYVDEHGLGDDVKVSGPLFKEEKFRVINDCDVFIFPTYYPFELFPGVILEAMQCGKPVISTYHAAIEDIIDNGETGFLVEPGNAGQIAEKIQYLVQHPGKAEEMGEKASQKFYREYTLEKFEENMRAVFDEI